MSSPHNDALLNRSLASVWHPCSQMKQHHGVNPLPLIPIARAQGIWLHDFEGGRYLDGISSWWVNLFGHCNPRINAAIQAQLERLEHVMLAGFTHQPVVSLSERLSALTGGLLGHCFYASDGASATEIALKMSCHSWRNQGRPEKQSFLCLAGSYHGETVGALAVTDIALFKEAYAALIRPAATVPTPDARLAQAGESARDVARRAAAALERQLAEQHTRLAALIIEPLIQCASGMVMYDPEYLRLARQLCRQYEVHLICDEIAVGFGRSGSFFAYEQAALSDEDVAPDFLCLSKGLSGGYLPLSVVLTREAIYQSFYDDSSSRGFLHSHSYTGNALACAAALATLDIFAQDDVLRANQVLAQHLAECFAPLAEHPGVRHLRQRGMVLAFDVVGEDADFPGRFYRAALRHEVLLRPISARFQGQLIHTIYVMPPYVISREECSFLAQAVAEALASAYRSSAS
ncbi:MAG: adenosylmethionine--8-amino-7-oxononanoate transaminase [Pseudomonadota bacterium]